MTASGNTIFTEPHVNLYVSSEGFSVEVTGRTRILYSENGRTILVDTEFLAGPSSLVIFADSIKCWQPPLDGEIIKEEERRRVLANIRAAFHWKGIEIQVHESTWPEDTWT